MRDIGVYTFGAARFVTGQEPGDISAQIAWENGVDSFAEVTAQFPGFGYSANVSTRMHPCQEMLFHGEAGAIRLTAPFNANVFGEARVELHRPDLEVVVKRFPGDNHYKLQAKAFGHSAETGAPYPCPLEFSRGTQVMIDRVSEVATPS